MQSIFLTMGYVVALSSLPIFVLGSSPEVTEKSGHVEIAVGDSSALILAIDLEDDEGGLDGLTDLWFILCSNAELDVKARSFGSADVLFGEGRVRVVARQSGETVDLLVGERKAFAAPMTRVPYRVYVGYGLSRYEGDTKVPIREFRKLHGDACAARDGKR